MTSKNKQVSFSEASMMQYRKTTSNLRHPNRLACGLIPLLNMLEKHGVPSESILSSMGIHTFEFIDPAFTISIDQELELAGKALQHFNFPAASLELAKHYHLHHFSVLGLAIRACATLGDCFELIRQYPRLQWGICETQGSVNGSTLTFELLAGNTRTERFLLERDMACLKTLFSEALNQELAVSEVGFSHKAPAITEPYETLFNCPVLFSQKITYLSIPLSELDKPIPTADTLSKAFYDAQCARISALIDEPFRYSWLIRDYLSRLTPIPSLDALATLLNIESRTLQRRLKKEQESFSSILQEVRLKRAKDKLLFSNETAESVAFELGFKDAVAFSHAFKQWTGLSPRQWRSEHTG